MDKRFIILTLGLALLGVVAYGTTRVYAGSEWGGHSTIIQKLVERFGLKEEDVKAVFDETRDEHKAQMQARLEERLNEAVESGEVTEEQKKLILAKHEELKAEREANKESFQDMTPEERHEAMETKKAELKSWAEANGIDLKYLFGGLGMRGGRLGGFKGGFGFGK